jgi:iron(III) transport system ATP-binding protein
MLEIRDLEVSYPVPGGVQRAVRGISLDIVPGEFFTLLGPSGCGKTTTLRSVAGLETPTGGSIRIKGETVFDAARNIVVATHSRNIAMVFQSYAIWPHMTVAENVGFPLEVRRTARAEIRTRVLEILKLVGLGGYAERSATQLSGGQQQRVALARALAKGADLLLLDEPLSNLDAKLREQMRIELRSLQERLGQTTIYVTHDQEEALSLSDRIALMKDGVVVEAGTPRALYLTPKRMFTAAFIGQAEFIRCTGLAAEGGALIAETPLGRLRIDGANEVQRGDTIMLRPEHIHVLNEGDDRAVNVVEGLVGTSLFSGKTVEYEIELPGQKLTVHAASDVIREPGDRVRLHFPPERCILLDSTE